MRFNALQAQAEAEATAYHVERDLFAQLLALGQLKTRIQEAEIESMKPLKEGYRGEECRSEYGDREQWWLVVYSEEAEERACESVREKVQKELRRKRRPSLSLPGGSSRAEKMPSRPSKSSSPVSRRANLQKSRSAAPPATRLRSPPRPAGKATGSKRLGKSGS